MKHVSIVSKNRHVPATAQEFDDILRVLNNLFDTLNTIVGTLVIIGDLNALKAEKNA